MIRYTELSSRNLPPLLLPKSSLDSNNRETFLESEVYQLIISTVYSHYKKTAWDFTGGERKTIGDKV